MTTLKAELQLAPRIKPQFQVCFPASNPLYLINISCQKCRDYTRIPLELLTLV